MRLGLIGAGRWGKVYIRTIEGLGPRLRLTHLATRFPENSSLVKGPVALFSDWKELIASEIDAVIIATPAPLHAEMTQACLEAGKPCIVEKPLCFDAKTAESLWRIAQKSSLLVWVNYIHLFNPAYQALKAMVAASGEPIRAIVSEGMDLGPFRPETGTLWDRCPHDVALCLDLMGGTRNPAPEVRALGGCPDAMGRPEMISIQLHWKKTGASAWIQSGRLSPKKKRALSVITDSHLYHFDEMEDPRCRKIPFDYARRGDSPQRDTLQSRASPLGAVPFIKGGEPIPVPSRLTPMEVMLTSFSDALEKRGPGSPSDLEFTVELTRILEECQSQIDGAG